MAVKGMALGPLITQRVVLAYANPITVDLALSAHFQLSLAGATALVGSPSNDVQGMNFDILITQTVGGQNLTWAADYDFGAEGVPNLAALAAGRQALVSCKVVAVGHVLCTTRLDFRAS